MSLARSPLAPAAFPDLASIDGVGMVTTNTGLRYRGRPDLLLMRFCEGTTAAGVFTRSKTRSAAVDWCRQALAAGAGRARGLVVNSGNANAFTGARGQEGVRITIEAASRILGCRPEEIFHASTGTIGVPLDGPRIASCLEAMAPELSSEASWEQAATAISTTDTYPKGAGAETSIDGKTVRISGIAKGSGMIAPDMATMLSFVVTDAAIAPDVLEALLREGADRSFNSITVDSDTSTSDTLLVFATGKAGNAPVTDLEDPRLDGFRAALFSVLLDLAHQVVRDGEGATRFVTVTVTGATSNDAAKRIALAIANSPLVKTAIAGADANWGRVVMAVGKSGEEADRDRLRIAIGGVVISENGEAVEGYDETPVAEHMKGQEILIEADIGLGDGRATVWTCDLTHAYIDINADYRT
ncbi:bifunctional glutamate N-acetyltransferase/amino-acid acetyltransferase ArgJ [Phaeovibrio sulfidiphilus]|uniref:Arginine biosynthesis bifunctional protein ArgJ n=1 Tax=Phaeovibrio sulfidiphilus TaxID=1220600 RepID=A0A8J6YWQ7_9PROT|nr:bifunctional glutamate N-acetyltransferase/amino-acid acetyltransferase ArgJ [Phaeovibrio sulfidiphilus]MBE1236083.1 bifunctional glutamate N-acetyltransferase/amino-acid acetyltransferase ArgJ [Phaeovibrio sulfidiphilus]